MDITAFLGRTRVYAGVMIQSKSGVMLANADFPNLHGRSAETGILMLKDGEENVKANALADLSREILNNENEVNVSLPLKKFQFIFQNMDDSVTPSELLVAVASICGCDVEPVGSREVSRRW